MSSLRNRHRIALAGLMVSASCWLTMGCSMCAHPYDYSYTYNGQRWQRSDMNFGRVGSAFYPAGEQLIHDPPPAPPGGNPNSPKDGEPSGNPYDPLQPSDGSAPSRDKENKPEEKEGGSTTSREIRYRQDAQRAIWNR